MSLSKTPSPPKDRIYGSKVNPKGSASSEKSAQGIKLSSTIIIALTKKLNEFKETHSTKKVSLSDLKAVYRRGLGAYSKSHRPTISGGKPNSRNAWAMARVNAFLRKASGGESKKAYVQDDDLMKYADGGEVNDCINYIKDNQSIFDNGYYFDMNDLSKVIDPYGQVPLNLDFTLVSYNSGGQKNLDVIDTINPTTLVDKLSELLSISKNQSYVVVHYVIDKAKRLTNTNQITTEKIVVVDRDMVVCENLNQDIKCRRCGWEWNTKDSEEFDKYVCHNCGFDNRTFYDKEPIGLKDGGETEDRIRRNQKKYLGYDDLPQSPTEKVKGEDTLKGRYEYYKSHKELFGAFENGGEVDDKKKTYEKWKSLVNMSYGEVKKFYDSEEGKKAGLSSAVANKQGISNGRESARWVMKMKTTPKSEWTPTMWKWANKQISFISRMSGNQGDLYDDKGNKTRKHTSLLIWGHNPKKSSSMKYAKGGSTSKFKIYHETLSEALDEAERYIEANGYYFAEDRYFPDVTNGGIRYGETKSISRELDGKRKNTLLAQIYRMDSGRYELNMYFAYEGGGQMDVRMEDTVQRMDDPNFADISFYMRGGKIDWTEFYKDGGMNKTCEKFDKNGERKIDMKSIEDLTYCVNKLPQTKEFHFHDGQYDADRKKLHKEIIYKIKKDLVCVESDKPIAILMGGSPASGKSTFLKKYRPYLLEEEILKVDADEIRSQLPEYKGFNATQTHLETKDIVNLLLSDRNIGIPCRFDLIYDGTMNNTKSYLPLIALLKSLGYRIYVVYIDNVPKDVIVNRALERYKRSGRFVPLEVIDDFFTRGKSALNEIKKEVDGYMIVDGKDSNYHVIEKGGMQLPKNRRYSKIGEPIKITTEDVVREYKRGGELNPDNPQLKNEVVHKSGKVGGMLVGKRHSEGGIKAINKSTGQPLEMEGGEVVITRNAVSDDKKRMFEGKMMTNKEILSKINESGGGVSFAKGGNVKKKDDCGCGGYESGGNVKDMKSQYPKDFKKGLREELREHSDTFGDLKRNKISLKEASERVVAKHLSEKPNYYKNYKYGGYLTFADKQIPSLDAFVKGKFLVDSPFVGESTMYSSLYNEETKEHKYHRVDDKKAKPISDLLAYETYLYDNFGILFSKLPIQVQNALTLGKQALIDNYINS